MLLWEIVQGWSTEKSEPTVSRGNSRVELQMTAYPFPEALDRPEQEGPSRTCPLEGTFSSKCYKQEPFADFGSLLLGEVWVGFASTTEVHNA